MKKKYIVFLIIISVFSVIICSCNNDEKKSNDKRIAIGSEVNKNELDKSDSDAVVNHFLNLLIEGDMATAQQYCMKDSDASEVLETYQKEYILNRIISYLFTSEENIQRAKSNAMLNEFIDVFVSNLFSSYEISSIDDWDTSETHYYVMFTINAFDLDDNIGDELDALMEDPVARAQIEQLRAEYSANGQDSAKLQEMYEEIIINNIDTIFTALSKSCQMTTQYEEMEAIISTYKTSDGWYVYEME